MVIALTDDLSHSFLFDVHNKLSIVWLRKRSMASLGVATTSWKLLQISTKLSFTSLMMKPISIFWSDESPGRTRSAHVACAQLLSRLAGHSVCALRIHPIKKSKWVSSLGFKNLAFQKFAVISMIVQFFLATPNPFLTYFLKLIRKRNYIIDVSNYVSTILIGLNAISIH